MNTKETRLQIGELLQAESHSMLAINGPCAMTADIDTITREGEILANLSEELSGLVISNRLPPWKPRSNPYDWHGEETTDLSNAVNTLTDRAMQSGNISIELGLAEHLMRYSRYLSFAWVGARNDHKFEFKRQVALYDPELPLAFKNGLDGEIEASLQHIEVLQTERGEDAAPIVLLYRGGTNAQDPQAWEKQYKLALEATNGRCIVDVAHGGEMAHDPKGKFQKSVFGQIACMEHVIELIGEGFVPRGIMLEASDTNSPTDPHMPFNIAIDGLRRLHAIRFKVPESNHV